MCFSQVIDTGIHHDPFEPAFQQGLGICSAAAAIKLLNIPEQFYKRFAGQFFCLFRFAYITETYPYGIVVQPVIKIALAVAVVLTTTVDQA